MDNKRHFPYTQLFEKLYALTISYLADNNTNHHISLQYIKCQKENDGIAQDIPNSNPTLNLSVLCRAQINSRLMGNI